MKKDRKQNVVALLQKEIAAMEAEEMELKRQLQTIQAALKDVKQAVLSLQSSTVHIPLSAKVFDAIQEMGRFVSAAEISELLVKKEEYLDLRSIKRDVNSALNRMKKKSAIAVIDTERIQFFGLADWLDSKGKPQAAHAFQMS